MNSLKLALLAVAAAIALAAAFRSRSGTPARDELAGFASLAAIDEFLSDSRRYLGL